MVPPWVPDFPQPDSPQPDGDPGENPSPPQPPAAPPIPPQTEDGAQPSSSNAEQSEKPAPGSPKAPLRRFAGANTSLGHFAHTGDHTSMRRGVGQYIKKGYGGSATATRRFGSTAQTANSLFQALSGTSATNPFTAPGRQLDPALLNGRTADEVMDAVVEAVRPVDGTQDAEANRAAIRDALSDLLDKYPNANLLELNNEQRQVVIERYVSGDVFRRLDLDLGKKIRAKAPSAAAAMGRLKEIREYVRETVAASFRSLRNSGQALAAGRISHIVQSALRETFQVFEEYAE